MVLALEVGKSHHRSFAFLPNNFPQYFFTGGSERPKEKVQQGGERGGKWSVFDAETEHEEAEGLL